MERFISVLPKRTSPENCAEDGGSSEFANKLTICTASSGTKNIQNNQKIHFMHAATQITNSDESNDSEKEKTSFNIQQKPTNTPHTNNIFLSSNENQWPQSAIF